MNLRRIPVKVESGITIIEFTKWSISRFYNKVLFELDIIQYISFLFSAPDKQSLIQIYNHNMIIFVEMYQSRPLIIIILNSNY
jgi:hypothetical protein